MKLFLRKYLLTILLAICIYTLLYAFRKNEIEYLTYSFFISVILSILIRLFDDLTDYDEDLIKNKNVFKRNHLILLIIILMVICSFLIIISNSYLFFIQYLLFVINIFDKKILNYTKSLYVPLICFGILYYNFGFSIFNIIFIVLLFIVDIYLWHNLICVLQVLFAT